MTKIEVIGAGHIGLPLALLSWRAGHEVSIIDKDARRLESISAQSGADIAQEPGLLELLADALVSPRFTLGTSQSQTEAHFICVPTPVDRHRRPDLTDLYDAFESICSDSSEAAIFIQSTVPPGTCRRLAKSLPTPQPLYYVPERAMPGRTLHEMQRLDRIIGATTASQAELAVPLMASLSLGAIRTTTFEAAELAKLFENTYRDVNIALANQLADSALRCGADPEETIRLANNHPRVSIHRPGTGVGGHCLTTDPYLLMADGNSSLVAEARTINEGRPGVTAARILSELIQLGATQILVLGSSYRADTVDYRSSPALEIIGLLREAGIDCEVVDCTPDPNETTQEKVDRSSTVLILVRHSHFSDLDFSGVSNLLQFEHGYSRGHD